MTGTMEQQLVDLERQYWNAMIAKDVDTAVRMSDDPCYVTGAQGVSAITNQQFRALMADAKWVLHSYTMDRIQARLISPDVGVVAYTVTENLTVDGKPLTLVANDSSTWVRRNGQWKNSLHTEAVAGDPFGRDRKPRDPWRTQDRTVKYAALLRGINVGGNKKIAMAQLRSMIEALGYEDPKTLLQSGNLVFATKRQPLPKLEQALESATKSKLGVECSYVVRTQGEWTTIIDNNPYAAMARKDPSHMVVVFCRDAPDAAALKTLRADARGDEDFAAVGRELFVCYPHGQGESKLALALSKNRLGTICTARNWNTVLKIAAALG